MASSKSQKEKILGLSIKDKKLSRLFFCSDLNERDSLFLNNVYEERNSLHFRYCFMFPLFTAIVCKWGLFRSTSTLVQGVFMLSIFLGTHLYWSAHVNRRFELLTEPYY
jgi:hypothetical protein